MRRVTQLSLVLLSVAGCPLAHDDPTPQACRSDDDCFTAEGEYCDRPSEEDGVCRLRRVRSDLKLTPDTGAAADLEADLEADLDAGSEAALDAAMESGPVDATPDTPGGE